MLSASGSMWLAKMLLMLGTLWQSLDCKSPIDAGIAPKTSCYYRSSIRTAYLYIARLRELFQLFLFIVTIALLPHNVPRLHASNFRSWT